MWGPLHLLHSLYVVAHPANVSETSHIPSKLLYAVLTHSSHFMYSYNCVTLLEHAGKLNGRNMTRRGLILYPRQRAPQIMPSEVSVEDHRGVHIAT